MRVREIIRLGCRGLRGRRNKFAIFIHHACENYEDVGDEGGEETRLRHHPRHACETFTLLQLNVYRIPMPCVGHHKSSKRGFEEQETQELAKD